MTEQYEVFKQKLRTETIKYLKWYMPNKEQVSYYKKLKRQGTEIGRSIRRGNFHRMLQKRLKEMAEEYGVIGESEYTIESPNIKGRIDVMWRTKKGTPFVAIEIDTKNNHDAVMKLLAINAKYKIWIFTGTTFDIEDYAYLGEIHLNTLQTECGQKVDFIIV